MLTNGTKAIVRNIPQQVPANKPVKFDCQGNEHKLNRKPQIIKSLNNAKCGLRNCFQCVKVSNTIRAAITPDSEAKGPTC